jgi:hypothetical protein
MGSRAVTGRRPVSLPRATCAPGTPRGPSQPDDVRNCHRHELPRSTP